MTIIITTIMITPVTTITMGITMSMSNAMKTKT